VSVPLHPSADEARRWLAQELAKNEYRGSQPGFFDRLAQGFWNWVTSLRFGNVSGTPALALIVLLVVVAAAIVVLFAIYGVPRLNRRGTSDATLFGDDDRRPARDLRASAARAADAGDYGTAIVETYRALARSLSERGLVETAPGTTAHAFAVRASAVFEAHRPRILLAAESFDDVRYLDRIGTEADFERLRDLDRELDDAQPTRSGTPLASTSA
jgi:hypothetical protein